MKKFIMSVVVSAAMWGCASNDDVEGKMNNSFVSDVVPKENLEKAYMDLANKIDEVNAEFQVGKRSLKETYLVYSTVKADMDGWDYGSRIGFFAGGWIGGFSGMVPGYVTGGLIGGAALSAIHYIVNKTDSQVIPNDVYSMVLPVYAPEDSVSVKVDSLGYYHNLIVNQIYDARNAFIRNDLSVNKDALIRKVNSYAHVYGFCEKRMSQNEVKEMSIFAEQIDSIQKLYLIQKIDEEKVCEASLGVLQQHVKLDECDINEIRLINQKVLKKCSELNPEMIPVYVERIQEMIDKSPVVGTSKAKMKSAVVFMGNSAMCVSSKE